MSTHPQGLNMPLPLLNFKSEYVFRFLRHCRLNFLGRRLNFLGRVEDDKASRDAAFFL